MLRRLWLVVLLLMSASVMAGETSAENTTNNQQQQAISASVDASDQVTVQITDAASASATPSTTASTDTASPVSKNHSGKQASSNLLTRPKSGGLASGVVETSPLTVIFGLLFVIALIFLMAWLMRRVSGMPMLNGQAMKVVSALSVGNREKIVLVDVGGKQLLIGVAAGHVSPLHYFDEPVIDDKKPVAKDFSGTLKSILQSNKVTHSATNTKNGGREK